jgi:antitoxin component of MazEF toxin-antitoxin module
MNDETTTLRFSGNTVLGVIVPEDDFRLLGLAEGTRLTITVDSDSIPEDEIRRELLARTSAVLLPKGTLVVATVGDSGGITVSDNEYAKVVARTAPGVPKYHRWHDVIPVEVILMEDLAVSTRVHGGRRLHSCRCRIPYLEAEARSLNHALSLIVRHFEPSRISAVSNAFKAIYVAAKDDKWCRLEELGPG